MIKGWMDDPRRTTNPLFNDNRMKLGVFGTNAVGCALTLAEEAFTVTWPKAVGLSEAADRAGFEAIVPYARWKGYVEEKPSHRTGIAMDCYTWAAGMGQATDQCAVFATSHVPTIHPLLAAKQCATIDHITGGRFGLNVVAGWNKPELDMFGAEMREHDDRYDQAAEWLDLLRRLWQTDEAFDFEGQYYALKKAVSLPHPVQAPFPPIMNAGGSDKGRHFAAKFADIAFVILRSDNVEGCRAEIAAYKDLARHEYGRDIQVWTHTYVVQRNTQAEADEYLRYYALERGDEESVDGWLRLQNLHTQLMPPGVLEQMRLRFKAGAGGFPLVGTADTIVDRLSMLADAGLNGVLLTWVDYEDGMSRWVRDVMPRMEQAGLRTPVRVTA